MNLFDMTMDDWILFAMVIAILAIPSLIRPFSLWLGKKIGFVKADAEEASVTAFQDMSAGSAESSESAREDVNSSSPGAELTKTAEDGEQPPSGLSESSDEKAA